MTKPTPARYRMANWSSDTASLRERGSLLIWLDKKTTWLAPPGGSPGRPAVLIVGRRGVAMRLARARYDMVLDVAIHVFAEGRAIRP